MLAKRVLVAAILLPIGLVLIYFGGWPFAATVALILALASREYVQLFATGGHLPAGLLVIAAGAILPLARNLKGFEFDPLILSLFVLGSLTVHLVRYEKGRDQAASDFAVTVSGIMYLAFIGAYLVSLRNLPEGLWWLLLALPAVWLADSGAYFIGRQFGKHKMSKRLSPKKSWEGYFGGLVIGTAGTVLLALAWQSLAAAWPASFPPATTITLPRAALLGFIISAVTTLGDLGESMIKRQFGAKDSGTLLPGHGGVFDRIDSWIWAGVIGFYLINYFFIGGN